MLRRSEQNAGGGRCLLWAKGGGCDDWKCCDSTGGGDLRRWRLCELHPALGPALRPPSPRTTAPLRIVPANAPEQWRSRCHRRSSKAWHIPSMSLLYEPRADQRRRAANPILQLQEHPTAARAEDRRCRARDRRAQVRDYASITRAFIAFTLSHRSFAPAPMSQPASSWPSSHRSPPP